MQADKLVRNVSDVQANLSSALVALKEVESSLPAPGIGIAGQPHEAIETIAAVSAELNDILRRTDQTQAGLPPIRDANSNPSSQELARARVNDVDAATQVCFLSRRRAEHFFLSSQMS
jgi:hypothetical protein